jgi:hypothetical protein
MNQWVKPAQEPVLPGLRELLRAMHQRIEPAILLFFRMFCFVSRPEYHLVLMCYSNVLKFLI